MNESFGFFGWLQFSWKVEQKSQRQAEWMTRVKDEESSGCLVKMRKRRCTYLSVHIDHWAQQAPSARLAIDMKHAQYLKESDSSYGGRGEHLTIGAYRYDNGRCHDDQYVFEETEWQMMTWPLLDHSFRRLPMRQMGLRPNLKRPFHPMYLLRQPADQRRTPYSIPKKKTRMISI